MHQGGAQKHPRGFWELPGGRLKIWVGTVVGPITITEGTIWAGGQVKKSHRLSMGRATSSGQGLVRLESASPRAARHLESSRGLWLLSPDQQQGRHRSRPWQWQG